MKNKLSREEVLRIYKFDAPFLDALEEHGLITPVYEGSVRYIVFEELPALERYANWHYDLEVNMPGIEIIQNLLRKVEYLQAENRRLQIYSRTVTTAEDGDF